MTDEFDWIDHPPNSRRGQARHGPGWISFYDSERSPTQQLDPDIYARIDREDPFRTARALAAAGFSLRWRLVERSKAGERPVTRDVPAPMPGTRLFSISDRPSRGEHEVKMLVISLTPTGSSGIGTMLPPGALHPEGGT